MFVFAFAPCLHYIDFHFGWDFDRYWFEPLGDVFGIPGKQVEDIAANVIVNEWGMGDINGYNTLTGSLVRELMPFILQNNLKDKV